MKTNLLKLRRVLNATLFVLLFNVVGMTNALGQALIATLQHGNNIGTYYGSNAFVQAHDAAQTGDIITLSSGIFNPTTITKAITLRGAGCCMDTITGIYPTIFKGFFGANVSDNENYLTIEGIRFDSYFDAENLYNPRFIKCNFSHYRNDYDNSMQYAQFVNCIIQTFEMNGDSHDIQFVNCYLSINPSYLTDDHLISMENSIVRIAADGSIQAALAINSIFFKFTSYLKYGSASSSCLFTNCVEVVPGVSSSSGLFVNQLNNSTNISMAGFPSVFETFTGSYNNGFEELIYERFILNSDFASSFLGNDGTEVGIHGGQAPYNPRPNYMVLKQCNVANQSTVDGKLSVEIQVVSEGGE